MVVNIHWVAVIVSVVFSAAIAQTIIIINLNKFVDKMIEEEETYLENIKNETLKIVKKKYL